MKGPDNPTSQLLPTSNQRKAKMGWERHEAGKRRWHVQEMNVEEGRVNVFRVKVLLVKDMCVCVKVWCAKVWCVKMVLVCVCVCARERIVLTVLWVEE